MANNKPNDNIIPNGYAKDDEADQDTDMFEELDDEMLAMLVDDLTWPETAATSTQKQPDSLPDEPKQGEQQERAPSDKREPIDKTMPENLDPVITIESIRPNNQKNKSDINNGTQYALDQHSLIQQDDIQTVQDLDDTLSQDKKAAEKEKINIEESAVDVLDQEEVQRPRLRVSLRQRNAIQLHPFTLEYAQYRKMISNSATMKRRPFSISNAEYADSQLEGFLVAAQEEEATSQTLNSQYMPHDSITQSKSQSILSDKEGYISSEDEEIDFDSNHFDKYQLGKLILPKFAASTTVVEPSSSTGMTNVSSQKKEIITFKKKNKNKRSFKSNSLSVRKASSSSTDIFSFDHQPQAAFKITVSNKEESNRSEKGANREKDIFAFPDYGSDYLYTDTVTDEEEDEEDELRLNHPHRIKRRRIISDDSDEESSDKEQRPSHDIFKIPKRVKPNPRGLERKMTDDDVVPIVQDEYEFKQPKRRRMDIHDVLKKKHALNGLLPASFIKTFEKDLREEGQKRTAPKTRPKSTVAKNTKMKSGGYTKIRNTQDIFAAFLDSQSESESESTEAEVFASQSSPFSMIPDIFSDNDNDNDNNNDYGYDYDYDDSQQENLLPSTRSPVSNSNTSPAISVPKGLPSEQLHTTHSKTTKEKTPSLHKKKQPSRQDSLDESIEDNRIRTYHRQTKSKRTTSQRRSTHRSSIAIKKPANIVDHPMRTMRIQDNPAPHRRRKRPKRSKDDIYVHAPLFSRLWFDRSGQAPDNNSSVFFNKPGSAKRRAFDDIYVGTAFSSRYACEPLDPHSMLTSPEKANDGQFDAGLHLIHSLESVTKRIRHLYDHDLRRIRGLTDTVYLHHQLLKPLLSDTPDLSSAYAHLKHAFSEPLIFDRHIIWQNISFRNRGIIDFLFFKASRDLSEAFDQNEYAHLSKHDPFYVFVSICLTQWIPKFAYAERLRITEVFLTHIRSLAWLSAHLVATHSKPFLSFQTIIKLQLFCLDWTCRLHHLGVQQQDWSVLDCTQTLMDTLIYAGYERIKSDSDERHCLIEAWVCLIQIMSVSSQGAGYCFYEKIFLEQLRSSIKRKARDLIPNEFEKRKTTRMWAETLNYILDKYMMI